MPSVGATEIILAKLAPEYGVAPTAYNYNVRFRNPILSYMSAERLVMLFVNGGLGAVHQELDKLAKRHVLRLPPPLSTELPASPW